MDPLPPRPPLVRYALAVLVTGVAAAVRAWFEPLLGTQMPLLTFFFGVLIAAWWGGFGPGVLATVLGSVTGAYLFIDPRQVFEMEKFTGDVRPFLLLASGTVFSWTCAAVQDARRREAIVAREAAARSEELRREAAAREQTAAELLQFQSDLRTVFELAAVGIVQGDCRDGSIVRVNSKFCELLGYTSEELIGKTFREITHPDDREADYASFQRVIRGEKEEFAQEKRYLRKDGRTAWGYVNARVVRDRDGGARDSFAVVVDITERKGAEQALHERESQLRQIGDNLPQGFLYQITGAADGSRRFTYFSAGLEHITGVRVDEVLADAGKLYALIHPDDIKRVAEAEHRCLRDRAPFDVKIRLRHRETGEWRWAHVRSAPRTLANGTPVWDGVFLDITEARRTEEALARSMERLDLAQKASRIGVFDWQVHTGEVVWNDEQQRIFGLEPGTFGGRIEGWRERVHPLDLDRVEAELRQAMERQARELEFWFRILRPNGDLRWIEGAGRFFYEENGTPLRMVGVNIDVTEKHEAQATLRRAKEVAEAANNAKDHFLATLSHELRTPLAPVVPLVADLLSRSDLDEDVREDLEMIRRNIALEARLIDDLLDLTRVTKGKLDLRREVVDLHTLLERTRAICCQDEARGKEVRVELRFGAKQHHVWGDSIRIQQVFWNLINNACKFSSKGGQVLVTTSDAPDGNISVEVQDFGVGISEALLPRLFQPFEQGDRRATEERRGLGLGLAIAKPLVEAHEGRINVRSAGLGKGTTFCVTLPLASEQTGADVPAVPEIPALPQTRPPSETKILLVEDHLDTARVMERLLRARGYEVQRATSKAEALETGCREAFHILVSDIGLPDGSGLELMAELRKKAPILGIALSGFGTEADIKRSRDAGFLEHLVKPVDFDDLLRVIRDRCICTDP